MTPKIQSVCGERFNKHVNMVCNLEKGHSHMHHFEPVAEPASTGEPPLATPQDALRDAAGLCESEANRWSHDEKTARHWKSTAIQLRAQLLICDARGTFKCAADKSGIGGNTPQDCNWPLCGCDPYADKVTAALQESGIMLVLPRPAARPSEPSAKIGPWIHHKPDCAFATAKSIPIPECDCQPAPQTSAEPKELCGDPLGSSGYLEVYCKRYKGHPAGAHSPFGEPYVPAAPQPVSGDAPDMNDPRYCGACKHIHPPHEVDCRCYCDKVSCPECGPRIAARVMAAPAPSPTPSVSTIAEAILTEIIRDVAELPDRTSPDDWPEAMLVTADELRLIIQRNLESGAAQGIPQAQGTPEPPKVEEFVKTFLSRLAGQTEEQSSNVAETLSHMLRPYFPPASQTPDYRELFAELYQIAGVLHYAGLVPALLLDKLSAATGGLPIPKGELLPFMLPENLLPPMIPGSHLAPEGTGTNQGIPLATPASTARTDALSLHKLCHLLNEESHNVMGTHYEQWASGLQRAITLIEAGIEGGYVAAKEIASPAAPGSVLQAEPPK